MHSLSFGGSTDAVSRLWFSITLIEYWKITSGRYISSTVKVLIITLNLGFFSGNNLINNHCVGVGGVDIPLTSFFTLVFSPLLYVHDSQCDPTSPA